MEYEAFDQQFQLLLQESTSNARKDNLTSNTNIQTSLGGFRKEILIPIS
jgi:hypothetical protein